MNTSGDSKIRIQALQLKPASGLAFSVLFWICLILTFNNCDQTFEPLQENDTYHFAIYGTLDVSADTQWVRVGAVRQDIHEPPDPTGIKVTLEDLQSGENMAMNDALFTSKNILNYWATMDIKNEQTYRITAEHVDGKTSRVTVTTPKELPAIFITESPGDPTETTIYIDDAVEHIADLQSVWFVILNPGTDNQRRIYRFPLRNTLRHTSAFFGAYFATAIFQEELAKIEQSIGGADIRVASRQFFVAAGGPEWDDSLSSIDDLEYFLEGTTSNVENGLGYVVGVDTKWFRQRVCLTPDQSGFVPCTPDDGPFWHRD
jgi:hypothetical protein